VRQTSANTMTEENGTKTLDPLRNKVSQGKQRCCKSHQVMCTRMLYTEIHLDIF
jgi:hypothetical protein